MEAVTEPELPPKNGGVKMSKTNKELAVEVAIAYIQANSNKKHANGQSFPNLNVDNVNTLIESVHQTLTKLEDKNVD